MRDLYNKKTHEITSAEEPVRCAYESCGGVMTPTGAIVPHTEPQRAIVQCDRCGARASVLSKR